MKPNGLERHLFDKIKRIDERVNEAQLISEVEDIEKEIFALIPTSASLYFSHDITWDAYRYVVYATSSEFIRTSARKEQLRLEEAMDYEASIRPYLNNVVAASGQCQG